MTHQRRRDRNAEICTIIRASRQVGALAPNAAMRDASF
jgi:hypothetical protein